MEWGVKRRSGDVSRQGSKRPLRGGSGRRKRPLRNGSERVTGDGRVRAQRDA